MIDFINNPDSIGIIFYFVSFGIISWFMAWGVSFLISLFINIINKA